MQLAEALGEVQIDLNTIAQIRLLESIRPGVLGQLVGVFERTATTSLARIRQGVLENDLEQLRLTLHSLKGTAGSLGARRLSAIACVFEAEVQTPGTAPVSPRLSALAEQLEQEFRQVFSQLQELGRATSP
mgnify:CR=1 FL=1